MKKSYPTQPNLSPNNQRDYAFLQMFNLGFCKSLVDQNAIQFELTIKPDGIKINLIKKYVDKTVRKRQVELNNGEYEMLQQKIMMAIQELNLFM